MLNQLSASALLKAVIGVMAACVVAVLAVSGWTSWQRLQTAGRITVIAEASASAFKAMHNLRNDRPSTSRLLSSDQVIQPDMTSYLRTIRGDEMPAMRATVELLPAIDFADKETLIPALSRPIEWTRRRSPTRSAVPLASLPCERGENSDGSADDVCRFFV